MKEGFTFNYASLKFLRKAIFKTFGGGGEHKRDLLGNFPCYSKYDNPPHRILR